MLIEGFKKLGQPVATEKANFLANSTALAEDLVAQCELTAADRAASARHLGTDATNGNRRSVTNVVARDTEALRGASRALALRRAGAAVWASGAGGTHGESALGLSSHGCP